MNGRISQTRRRGVTLLELLIALTIIAIMLSMLLPAINLVREASLRTACDENLRQMSIAMQSYVDVHRGYLPFPAEQERPGGWAIAILPFMEESALADKFNTRHPLTTPQNRDAGAHRPPLLICPVIPEPKSAIPGIPVTSYLLIVEQRMRKEFRLNRTWYFQHGPAEANSPWCSSPEIGLEDRNYPPAHDGVFGW